MTYSDEIMADAVEALTAGDGSTFELPDGRVLHLSEEPDYDGSLEDFRDCYGTIAWPEHNRNGRGERPSDFNGNAEKIDTRDGRLWWQPPADVKRSEPVFAEIRQAVRDLLDYGTHAVLVELSDGTDAYGRPIVRGSASLAGIEPFADLDPCYLLELIDEAIEQADAALSAKDAIR